MRFQEGSTLPEIMATGFARRHPPRMQASRRAGLPFRTVRWLAPDGPGARRGARACLGAWSASFRRPGGTFRTAPILQGRWHSLDTGLPRAPGRTPAAPKPINEAPSMNPRLRLTLFLVLGAALAIVIGVDLANES